MCVNEEQMAQWQICPNPAKRDCTHFVSMLRTPDYGTNKTASPRKLCPRTPGVYRMEDFRAVRQKRRQSRSHACAEGRARLPPVLCQTQLLPPTVSLSWIRQSAVSFLSRRLVTPKLCVGGSLGKDRSTLSFLVSTDLCRHGKSRCAHP